MKDYLLLLVISLFVAHNVGSTYGELANTLMSSVVSRLERVQMGLR